MKRNGKCDVTIILFQDLFPIFLWFDTNKRLITFGEFSVNTVIGTSLNEPHIDRDENSK